MKNLSEFVADNPLKSVGWGFTILALLILIAVLSSPISQIDKVAGLTGCAVIALCGQSMIDSDRVGKLEKRIKKLEAGQGKNNKRMDTSK